MSKHFTRERVAEQALVRAEQALVQSEPRLSVMVDRSFELPKALYAATVALYLGFIAVLGIGFQSPGLAIPMAIFAFFIIAGFGVPTIWTRLAPAHGRKALTMQKLSRQGIATATGRLAGRDAAVQMLILPVLIVVWALIVVTIAATV